MPAPRSASPLVWLVSLLFLAFIGIPYLYAFRVGGEQAVFGGFLLNPLDGTSYLAKMYQGWRGDWLFTLPYTAEISQGSLLNYHYLLTGHLARLLGLPLLAMYHVFRILAAIGLLLAIFRFFTAVFPGEHRKIESAFALAVLGSGMGWLLVPFGPVTSDFWVVEAYPLLSAYTNPHFSLSLALLLAGLAAYLRQSRSYLWLGVGAFILGWISPFGLVIFVLVVALHLAWQFLDNWRRGATWLQVTRQLAVTSGWRQGLVYGLAGAPMVLYALIVTRSDPVLAGWNAQNITLSPPVWDVAVSLSPILVLALISAWLIIKGKYGTPGPHLLVIWSLTGLILLYLPFGLQRRFMLGLLIPLAGLAASAMIEWSERVNRRASLYTTLILVSSAPTLLLILLAVFGGIQRQDPALYLYQDEIQAMRWLEQNTPAHAVILAAPETGLLIPAYSGRRVIYGHPFETVAAAVQQARVENFYRAPTLPDAQEALVVLQSQAPIKYIFYGPREAQLGVLVLKPRLVPVFQSGQVTIYALGEP